MPSPSASTSKLAELAVSIAVQEAQRGVFEDNNDNRGDRIDEYQAASGALGQAWCLKFVQWCFGQAAAQLGVKVPFPKIYAVPAFRTWAAREKLFVVGPPIRGDVIVFDPPRSHVGLVTGSVSSTGIVPTVEGNTWNHDPSKEGVYVRNKAELAKSHFVRV